MNTPTSREVEMPLLGRAMGYAAGLKDCHDCFADRAAIVLYDALTALNSEIDRLLEQKEQWRLSSVCRELTEQRDRLAEALEQLMSYQPRSTVMAMNERHVWSNAKEALRSLNQPTEP